MHFYADPCWLLTKEHAGCMISLILLVQYACVYIKYLPLIKNAKMCIVKNNLINHRYTF